MSEAGQSRLSQSADSAAQTGVTLEPIALWIAEHLAGQHRSPQAAKVLSAFISRNASAVSIRSVLALARLVHKSENWEQAAELWDLVLAEDPQNIEGLIRRSHCLVERNDFPAAARTAEQARRWLKDRPDPESEMDSLLDPIYLRLFSRFENADHEKCRALASLCALPGSYAGRISEGAAGLRISDEQILRRINEAFEQWHASAEYRAGEPSAAAGLPEPAKTRILLVFRQYFFGGSDTREHELTAFLRQSAKALGYRVFFFPATAFLLGDRVTPDQQYEALDNLLRCLLATRPHVVIFDDLCARVEPAPHIGREVYRNTLVELKNQLGFKLAAYYPDPWVKATLEAVEYVSEFADLVWHQNVTLSRRSSKAHAEKLFAAPIPYLESIFQSGREPRTIGPAFLGSVYSYNYLRALWCTLIRERQVPCQLLLAKPHERQIAGGRCDRGVWRIPEPDADHGQFLRAHAFDENYYGPSLGIDCRPSPPVGRRERRDWALLRPFRALRAVSEREPTGCLPAFLRTPRGRAAKNRGGGVRVVPEALLERAGVAQFTGSGLHRPRSSNDAESAATTLPMNRTGGRACPQRAELGVFPGTSSGSPGTTRPTGFKGE